MPTDREDRRMHSPSDRDAERGIFGSGSMVDAPSASGSNGHVTRQQAQGTDGAGSVFADDDLSFDDELEDLDAMVGQSDDAPSADDASNSHVTDEADDQFAEYRFSELPFERIARAGDTGTWGSFDIDAPLHREDESEVTEKSEGPDYPADDMPDNATETGHADVNAAAGYDDESLGEDETEAVMFEEDEATSEDAEGMFDDDDSGTRVRSVTEESEAPDAHEASKVARTGVPQDVENAPEPPVAETDAPHAAGDGADIEAPVAEEPSHTANDAVPHVTEDAHISPDVSDVNATGVTEPDNGEDTKDKVRKPRGLRVHTVPDGSTEMTRQSTNATGKGAHSEKAGRQENEVEDAATKPSIIDRFCSHLPSAVSVVLLTVLVLIGVVTVSEAYDNDQWFIIATGRHIVETLSVPMENPFSIHDGMRTVIQQWLPSVWTYLSFDRFGEAGIFGVVAVEIAVLLGCLYALGRQAKRHSTPAAVLLLMVPTMMTLTAYISIRPQIITMVMMTLTLLVMERYRKGGNVRTLLWLPVIGMAHVNLHASMAPMDLAIVGCYLVPDLPAIARRLVMWYRGTEDRLLGRIAAMVPHRHSTTARALLGTPGDAASRDGWGRRAGSDQVLTGTPLDGLGFRESSYPRLPLLAAIVAMCLAMCVNPYGIDGALYLVHSYGAADYGSYISEMGRLTPASSTWGMMSVAMIAIGAMGAGRNGMRRIDFPLTVAMLVCGYVGFQHVRNVWLAAIFAFLLAAKAFGDARIDLGKTSLTKLPAFATCLAVIIAFTVPTLTTAAKSDVETDTRSVPKVAMDWLDSHLVDKDTAKVFSFFNAGGYIEYRGYKVEMDPRPELWEPGITKLDSHWYHEFVDAATGSIDIKEMVERYDFDYLVVDTGSTLYSKLQSDASYRIVADGNGYALWQHLRIGSGASTD